MSAEETRRNTAEHFRSCVYENLCFVRSCMHALFSNPTTQTINFLSNLTSGGNSLPPPPKKKH